MRRSIRTTVGAAGLAALVLTSTGCGDRITAARTFTAQVAHGWQFPSPTGPAGVYDILDGPLVDGRGQALAGTHFHSACFEHPGIDTGPYHCQAYLVTGSKTYVFSGIRSSSLEGALGSLAAGGRGRLVVALGLGDVGADGVYRAKATLKLTP